MASKKAHVLVIFVQKSNDLQPVATSAYLIGRTARSSNSYDFLCFAGERSKSALCCKAYARSMRALCAHCPALPRGISTGDAEWRHGELQGAQTRYLVENSSVLMHFGSSQVVQSDEALGPDTRTRPMRAFMRGSCARLCAVPARNK